MWGIGIRRGGDPPVGGGIRPIPRMKFPQVRAVRPLLMMYIPRQDPYGDYAQWLLFYSSQDAICLEYDGSMGQLPYGDDGQPDAPPQEYERIVASRGDYDDLKGGWPGGCSGEAAGAAM